MTDQKIIDLSHPEVLEDGILNDAATEIMPGLAGVHHPYQTPLSEDERLILNEIIFPQRGALMRGSLFPDRNLSQALTKGNAAMSLSEGGLSVYEESPKPALVSDQDEIRTHAKKLSII